jgi:hypothetical protein
MAAPTSSQLSTTTDFLAPTTHAWANQYGKLRRWSERRRVVVAFWLLLALALIVVGGLIRRAWTHPR